MAIPSTYSFTRYLAAKKSVDDRALNWQVWRRLTQILPHGAPTAPVQVLEIGAGIGTMVERLVEREVLHQAVYTAIDADAQTIVECRRRLPAWMGSRGFRRFDDGPTRQGFERQARRIVVDSEAIDLQRFVARTQRVRAWDLLIAHALLDELDLPTALPDMISLLRPGGLCYFTLVFDGATLLQPEVDSLLDAQIETLYHQTMDQRHVAGHPSGDSHSGRHVFEQLRGLGVELLEAGSSDWVVFAGSEGYRDDEAYFLHFIVHTIATALECHPQLAPDRLAAWTAERQAQIERGALVYIAHQLDFLGRIR